MTQPFLNRQNLAQLVELAKATEEKIRIYNQESQKIAEKWQNKADKKR